MTGREREQLVGQLAARGWVRLVQQTIEEATAAYWLRRAADFDAVPLPEVALACRRRASLAELTEADALEMIRDLLLDSQAAAAA
jgi:hypothetical protein